MEKREYPLNTKIVIFQLFSLLFLLNSITIIILFYLDSQIIKVKRNEIISNGKALIKLEQKIIENDISKVLGDLHFFQESITLTFETGSDIKHLENIWLYFSNRSKMYDQIRYLDNDGNEKIRINYENGKAVLVPQNKLQNKKNRYYFYETMKLNKNQHYISKLDLNIEGNAIEYPIKPMLRFSTRIFVNDKPMGMIIVNYLAGNLLSNFTEASKNSMGTLNVLNSNGYWITGGSNDENWAFMYDEKKENSFKKKYPLEWNNINKGLKEFITDKLIINGDSITIQDTKHIYDSSELILGDGEFKILFIIKTDSKIGRVFSENLLMKIERLIKGNISLFLLVSILGIIIELVIVIAKKSYLKIKYNSEHDLLTHTFNRKTGFEIIEQYFKNDNRRKSNHLSVCFIDVNGLKQVNDILGHDYGDELIITVANVIKKTVRENDFVIRLGGDEFLLVFVELESNIAKKVWDRIVQEFNEININENRKYIISVSHGIIDSLGLEEKLADKIVKKADEKMYEEKKLIKESIINFIK